MQLNQLSFVFVSVSNFSILAIKSRSTASAQLSATPTNYRNTDKHPALVMTLIALCRTRQSRDPIIDRCAPDI